METELAKDIAKELSPTSVAIMVAVAVYLIKTFWESFFKTKDKTDENTQAVRELNINIVHMRDRLVVMESKLDKYESMNVAVSNLTTDYNHLFEKVRDLTRQLEKLQDETRQ